MQTETCHFQAPIILLSEDMTLLSSLKHCLEMKLLNVLLEELQNSTPCIFMFVKWNYLQILIQCCQDSSKTAHGFREHEMCPEWEGNCFSFVQNHWFLLSIKVLSPDCTVKQCKKAGALRRGCEWETGARFPFLGLSLLGMPDCSTGRSSQLWREGSVTRRKATNELEHSGVKGKKIEKCCVESCHDYVRWRRSVSNLLIA